MADIRTLKVSSRFRLLAAAAIVVTSAGAMSGAAARAQGTPNSLSLRPAAMAVVSTLDMVSPSSGWGWGPSIVVHTTDGARHLVSVTPAGVGARRPVVAGTAVGAQRAWIVTASPGRQSQDTVYRTHDGGAMWSSTPVALGSEVTITSVDARHGWLQSSRSVDNHRSNEITLLRTVDGGRTWATIHRRRERVGVQPNDQTRECTWGPVRFSTPLRGVVGLDCRSATLLADVTIDGGKTWRLVRLPPLRHPPGIVMFSNVQPPFLAGKNGIVSASVCVGDGVSCYFYSALYGTSDGGRTWHEARSVVRGGQGAVFADSRHAWLPYGCLKRCSSDAALLTTENGGNTWVSLRLPTLLGPNMHGNQSFQYVSPSAGFAVEAQEFVPGLHYFRTTDGGRSFHQFHPRIVGRRAVPARGTAQSTQPAARRWCVVSQVQASASWQSSHTTLIGGIVLSSRNGAICDIRGQPRIAIYSGGHRLRVQEERGSFDASPAPVKTIIVGPGHQAGVPFDWSNWCGAVPHAPDILKLSVPPAGGEIVTYVTGEPRPVRRSSGAPICLAPSQPSKIYVGLIRAVTPADPLP